MRRWETLVALLAVVLASAGSMRFIPGHVMLTIVAVVLILAVGGSRLASALGGRAAPSGGFDAGERAKEIRERRKRS